MIAQLKDTIANNSVINHDSRNSFEKLKNTKLPQISSEKLNSLTPMPNLAKRHAIIGIFELNQTNKPNQSAI
jgi:hypothetical protein